MFVKFLLLLFCCALINAKTLIRKDPRYVAFAGKDIQHDKLPSSFKGIFQRVDNHVEGLENIRVGANPRVQATEETNVDADEDDFDDNSNLDTASIENKNQEQVENNNKNKENQDNNEEEDEEAEEEEEEEEEEKEEKKQEDEKYNSKEQDQDENDEDKEDDDDDDANHENDKTNTDQENVDSNNNENIEKGNAEQVESNDAFQESNEEEYPEALPFEENAHNVQSSYASVGMKLNPEQSFKFPKDQINTFPVPQQNLENNKPSNTDNFFDLQTLTKNLPPLKKFFPENNSEQIKKNSRKELDDDSIMQQIAEFESESENKNKPIVTDERNPAFNVDLDNKFVGDFISQSIPKNFGNLQDKLQGLGEIWQTIPKNVGKFQNKLQGLKDMWMNRVNQNFQPTVRKDSKVGFGGWDKQQKAMFADLTKYVNKAVEQAQENLEDNGRSIVAHNPPLTINLIPGTPVTFILKRVEGAHTIDQQGQSRAIRYNKLYAFTRFRFAELRYYYDVIIKPMNLFGIRKSITVILTDAPTRMSLSIENTESNNNDPKTTTGGKINVMGLEFVNPEVTLDTESNKVVDYICNYAVNDVHPLIKQKLVEIVSRDSKLILVDYLKDSQ